MTITSSHSAQSTPARWAKQADMETKEIWIAHAGVFEGGTGVNSLDVITDSNLSEIVLGS